ncbi:MAG: FAD-dependent monooxygenase [Alphaproteobacteria bacterium]|nr:FAD-dependent monooxygenase [Alphaproteobacteria bacterium]MBM4438145.1 FAD-dependent monooxygenase [Actinomycetota bacterium]
MKVTIVGAGSAGLASAIALRAGTKADVTILERAKEGDAPGLGLGLLPYALQMISLRDFPAYANSFTPIGRTVEVFAGQLGGDVVRQTRFQDVQYVGVKRADLLSFLTAAATKQGATIRYGEDVTEARIREEKDAADILIGADGAGSQVRATFAEHFAPRSAEAKSRFAWLELEGHLDHFMFGYIYVGGRGLIRITAYPYTRTESTAIVTHSVGWSKHLDQPGYLDADGSISAAGLQELNDVFAAGIGNRRLVGRARWRTFRATQCKHAAFDNVALVGDAFATLHFETGWGTSAAIQEASMLGHALLQARSAKASLQVYNDKVTELQRGAIMATAKTMREIDAQSARFFKLGPAKFLESRTA